MPRTTGLIRIHWGRRPLNLGWISFPSPGKHICYQRVQSGCCLLLTWSNQHAINIVYQCDILWKRHLIKIPSKLWYRAGELTHPRGKTVKAGTAGLSKFSKSIDADRVPNDVLICLGKDTTSGTTAAVGVTIDSVFDSPLSFSMPICLLHWPDRRVKGRCGRSLHPCILQVPGGGTNVCSSSRDVMLFLIHYFPWLRQLERLRLPFPTRIFLSPQVGTNVRILLTSKYACPNYIFWNWGK